MTEAVGEIIGSRAELRRLAVVAKRRASESAVSTRLRDDAIRAAVLAGMTHREVAEITGLTYGRIGQISRFPGE